MGLVFPLNFEWIKKMKTLLSKNDKLKSSCAPKFTKVLKNIILNCILDYTRRNHFYSLNINKIHEKDEIFSILGF